MRIANIIRMIGALPHKLSSLLSATASMFTLPADCVEGQFSDVQLQGNSIYQFIQNGNLTNGTTGFGTMDSTLSVANNILSVTGTGGNKEVGALYVTSTPLVVADKYALLLKVRVTNANCQSITVQYDGTTAGTNKTVYTLNAPSANQWYRIPIADTLPEDAAGNFKFLIYATYADAATANGKVMDITEIMALDLTAHGLGSLTGTDCNTRFPNWLSYGVKSTFPDGGILKSVGKNLFDKTKANINKYIAYDTGVESDTSGDIWYSSPYIKVDGGTVYTGTFSSDYAGNGVAFYDSNKNYISGISIASVSTYTHTFTTPNICSYIRFGFNTTIPLASPNILDKIQLEKGSIATIYEKYTECTAVIPPQSGGYKSVGSGSNIAKDEYSVTTGEKIQKVSDDKGTNIKNATAWNVFSEKANTIVFYIDFINCGLVNVKRPTLDYEVSIGTLNIGGVDFPASTQTNLDNLDTEGFNFNYNSEYLRIRINKSRLAGITVANFISYLQAQSQVSVIYQLSQVQVTKVPITITTNGQTDTIFRTWGANTTITVEPVGSPQNSTLPSLNLRYPIAY